MTNWLAFTVRSIPLLIALGGALITLLAAAFARGRPHLLRSIALVALSTLIASFVVAWYGWGQGGVVPLGTISFDRIAIVAWLIVLFAAGFTVLLSLAYLPEGHHVPPEYYPLLLFTVVGMGIMVAASNIVTLVIGLEMTALPAYVLAGIIRYNRRCNEAAIKYFLTGSFALAFIIMGAAFLFGAVGSLDIAEIAARAPQALSRGSSGAFLFGSAMVLAGFGFKVAAVPFHAWAPDVYEGAPTPITAFIATAMKAAAFVVLARLAMAVFGHLGSPWIAASCTVAIVTMFLGNLAALAQENIKRLLAYSSIAHVGYILVIFPSFAAGGDAPLGPIVLYLVAYAVMTMGAFAVVVALNEGHEEHLNISSLAGLSRRRPGMAAALTLFLVSLAGFPPTFGFFAKYFLFLSAVKAGYAWLVVIAVFNNAMAVYYYLKPVALMYLRDERTPSRELAPAQISTGVVAVVFLCALATVFFGILPANVLDLILHSL